MNQMSQLAQTTNLDEASKLLELYGVSSDDLERVRSLGEIVSPHLEDTVTAFYDWLETQPEYEEFFSDPLVLKRVKGLVTSHWQNLFSAEVDASYLDRRRRLGATHARIGLPLNTYFAAMNVFLGLFTNLQTSVELASDGHVEMTSALTKLVHLDTAVVVDTSSELVNETIMAQSRSLLEMSTPVTEIWSGILLLPIIGLIDSKRAQDVMNAALDKISQTQARVFILDISGVGVVDTAVANHLIKITKATQLMGCESTISGISPAIAQTIVELGIDVGEVKTTGTMRDALEDAFQRLGLEIKQLS